MKNGTVILIAALAGAWILSRQRAGKPLLPTVTDLGNVPSGGWLVAKPSNAVTSGADGQTSPLSALFGNMATVLAPRPYVPLSGPGGATSSPAASGAPAGISPNTLLATVPGTTPDPSLLRGDLASMSDPQYWWMGPTIDVAIMRDDVAGAMADAGSLDLSPIMLEASNGMVLQ